MVFFEAVRRDVCRGLASLAACAMVAAGGSAVAQDAPSIPTRDELEAIEQARQAPAPRLQISGGIERSPCPLADPRFADVRITITDVTFSNLKGATEEEMLPAWQALRGTSQPVAVICEVRDAAATLLRNKGYLAAVQVPTQRIENGAVKLEVLYARVTAVRARGETRGVERKLTQYLSRLADDEIFDRNKAERYLLLARDIPGYNVQLTLKPAGTGVVGDLIGEVSVLRRPYQVDFTLQNFASQATGRFGAQLRAQAFGLTGMGDATFVSLYSTPDLKEQQIVQVGHSFRPGSEGLTVSGTFTYAWTEPAIDLGDGVPKLDATTLLASISARYPLIRSQERNVWVGGGFDLLNQDVDFIGPLSRDKLRVAWLRARTDAIDLDHRIPRWRYFAQFDLRKGLDILDATDGCSGLDCLGVVPPSRLDGDASATVIRAVTEVELAIGKQFSLLVAPRGQYAFDPVLSFEEFTLGNYTVGRGYDPGALTGDSGYGVVTELRGPRLQPLASTPLAIQPFAFFDAAAVYEKNVSGHRRLASAGAGFRATLSDKALLDAILAVPLDRLPFEDKKPDPRLLITLSTRLLPWEYR